MRALILLAGTLVALATLTSDAAADFEVADSGLEFEGDIALALHLDPTHFVARSLAQAPLLLVFTSDVHAEPFGFWLPPGSHFVEDFARGALHGLQLEVVSGGNGQWRSTGTLKLEVPATAGEVSLWVLGCGHALSRSGEGSPFVAATPAGSSLPAPLTAGAATHDHPGAFHVPVPTPSDKPKENTPPKLRKKPLPPV
jgi:hypothetical protein